MEMDYIEVSAKTVEDCITEACQKLSVVSDRLDYQVVSEGSRGFLGMGAKPAVIKARIKEEVKEDTSSASISGAAAAEEAARKAQEAIEAEKRRKEAAAKAAEEQKAAQAKAAAEKKEQQRKEAQERMKKLAETAPADEDETGDSYDRAESRERRNSRYNDGEGRDASTEKRSDSRKKIPEEKQLGDEEIAAVEKKAEDFLKDVFDKMKMEIGISMTFDKEWNTLNIDLSGDDMGVLIGKRGQTLDSLQYLVSLVINKESASYIHVKTDTENYRERRKETLESLARNIAIKVKRTRRPVELEPMNPYERRIIHSALQNDRYVTTHSEGEEPYRKVVVTLKSGRRYDRYSKDRSDR